VSTPELPLLADGAHVAYNAGMPTGADSSSYRIGEVAKRLGVSTRTLRYYEELNLLVPVGDRPKGAYRLYTGSSIAHLQKLLELRDLLGLSLEALVALAEAEEARAALRDTWDKNPSDCERLRILDEAHPLVVRQLELLHQRQVTLSRFAGDLRKTLRRIDELRVELRPDGRGRA
jgi:DNA-binding transcriptional MerR regulator